MTPEQWVTLLVAATPIVVAVTGLGVATATAFGVLILRKVNSTHQLVNSAYEASLKAAGDIGHAAGLAQGTLDAMALRAMIREEVAAGLALGTPKNDPHS